MQCDAVEVRAWGVVECIFIYGDDEKNRSLNSKQSNLLSSMSSLY